MGTGDYICITMNGGAPWGFRLQGGTEHKQPLQVSKVLENSKARSAGLFEGDEVVAINGRPCADLLQAQIITLINSRADTLQMLIKRLASGINGAPFPGTEARTYKTVDREDYKMSGTLERKPHLETASRGTSISEPRDPVCSGETESGTGLHRSRQVQKVTEGYTITPKVIKTPKAEASVHGVGTVVNLQVDFAHDGEKSVSSPAVTLSGAGPSLHPTESDSAQKTFRLLPDVTDKGATVVPVRMEAEVPSQPRVQVILGRSDRDKEVSWALPAKGSAESQVERGGGQAQAPPPETPSAVCSEDREQEKGDQLRSARDSSRPHKHRARHARLRRSESLSEKQLKEAKSKCKSIALLLTAAPNPSSKGVLMFKKRRQRAKKYTLISYGTGELEKDEAEEEEGDEGEEGDKDHAFQVTLFGGSESDIDDDFLSDPEDEAQIVTFDWDSNLLEVEKNLKGGDQMESLPETKGKGVMMFARRKQRMDQIAAEQEEMRSMRIPMDEPREATTAENIQNVLCYQTQQSSTSKPQTCVSKSYIEVSHNYGSVPNGIGGAQEMAATVQSAALNRTAKPFSAVQNRAAAPFSPTRSVTSPLSDLPAPPPYSSISPPPIPLYKMTSPVAGTAPPLVWSPSESMEQIASRDERIAVPVKKTGILQDAKKRSTAKPMFTFKEPPKVSPNPALLSLVQNQGKKGPGAGNESGPEEDYLSLGAEACNFMQIQAAKQRTPPPVAPKPTVKASPTTVTPISPVWSPSAVAPAQPPVFPSQSISQANASVPVSPAHHIHHSYQPPSTINLTGSFKGTQAAAANQRHTPKTPPTTPLAGNGGTAYEMPALRGKGAELFAKRQSRMEKYVVDSSTVQANKVRSSSPTPSLPPSWKYSSNVRAPPPVAYNPIQSPMYPLAATKTQPKSLAATKSTKKKPTKTLDALDVMKHQPYQLNASLFTFQPPSGDMIPKHPPKVGDPASKKCAQPFKPISDGSYTKASSVYSVPTYSSHPSFLSTPANESYESVDYPMVSKQEPMASSVIPAPRPKFSAKKVGVTAQDIDGALSLSFPGRRSAPGYLQRTMSVSSPAPGYSSQVSDPVGRRLSPWEAAAKSSLGFVDDAFGPRNIQASIAANVVSAARRKTLPEPPEAWKQRVSYTTPSAFPSAGLGIRRQPGVVSPPRSSVSAPSASLQWRHPYRSQHSLTYPGMARMEARSEYFLSSLPDSSYNPYPRAWRH
ncbi:synaptopodin-2 [Microcaecilia unicolor]|uniref:Synaptopodin-2 n=1 Tax=Microcaecilia unicolor TaxID=1415580 RepID=A0A6P7XAQ5_9AMPH|nr:synaptopodin-2 [Microcaecilia unicolor]